jgi:hypothetical protein
VAAADAELDADVARDAIVATEFAADVAEVAALDADNAAEVAEVAAAATCASAKSLRTASDAAVGVARFVILNPPADKSLPRVPLVIVLPDKVPPEIVAVEVNVPEMVAP